MWTETEWFKTEWSDHQVEYITCMLLEDLFTQETRVDQWHRKIAARIMRRENYMIAIVREQVIRVRIFGHSLPFSQSLYWLVQAIISGAAPDKIPKGQIRRASISLGIITLLLMPFTFIFLLFILFTFFLSQNTIFLSIGIVRGWCPHLPILVVIFLLFLRTSGVLFTFFIFVRVRIRKIRDWHGWCRVTGIKLRFPICSWYFIWRHRSTW